MNSKVPSSQMTNHRRITHLVVIPSSRSGKVRRQASPHHAALHPNHTHLLARGCYQRVKRKKGCRVKGTFIKLSGFKLMNSLKHRTPCLCCPQKLFTGKQLSLGKMKLQQKRRWEMKIHVSSVLFSSLPCQRDRGSIFFPAWSASVFKQTIIL